MKIQSLVATEVLDSRGNPTIHLKLTLNSGEEGVFIVPSGASTGKFEAHELRDKDKSRYLGKGVQKAKENIETTILNHITNVELHSQAELDKMLIELDGTEKKTNLGVNSILPVSMAFSKACAKFFKLEYYQYLRNLLNNINVKISDQKLNKYKPKAATVEKAKTTDPYVLPVPLINVLNGGEHANNSLSFQEFMIVPTLGDSFSEALRASCEVFQALKMSLNQKGYSTAVGDEGGFAPNLKSNEEALDILIDAIEEVGYTVNKEFFLAIDCAASEYFKNGFYEFKGEGRTFSSDQMVEYLMKIATKYKLFSIEDPLDQEDLPAWIKLTNQARVAKRTRKMQIIGDDLFVSNSKLLRIGIKNGLANSILVKINQIGTLSETLETVGLAKYNVFDTVISHRSGETEDTSIADLAVGLSALQIKTGSVSRAERTAKYNRLLLIEKELGSKAYYGGAELSEYLNE